MKFLSLLSLIPTAAAAGQGTAITAKHNRAVNYSYAYEEYTKSLTIDTNLSIFKGAFKDVSWSVSNGYIKFKNKEPTQLLLNKDQSEFITDGRYFSMTMKIDYQLDIDSVKGRQRFKYSETNNKFINQVANYSLEDKWNVNHGTEDQKFLPNFKNGNHAIQLRPYVEFPLDDLRIDAGHPVEIGYIELAITKVTFEGKTNVLDFDMIKMEPINTYYRTCLGNSQVKEWFDRTDFEEMFLTKYGVKGIRVDKKKTWESVKIDQLNHTKVNKVLIKIIPKDVHFYKGTFIQEVNFELFNDRPDDLKDIKYYDSNFANELEKRYFKLEDVWVDIYIDKQMIKIDGMYKFGYEDTRSIKRAKEFGSINIWFEDKVVAMVNKHEWIIKDEEKARGYIEAEEEKPIEIPEDNSGKEEEKIEEDKTEGNVVPDLDEPIETTPIKKKSNPLKYLWLLTIPISFGTLALLSWFIPFRKKKKRRNEIK